MTTSTTHTFGHSDEASEIQNSRDFYLRGAFEGALSATNITETVTSEIGSVVNDDFDPGEYLNAEVMRQRYQHMSQCDLYNRVLALEGYIFGATGTEAPEHMNVSEYDDDLGEMDESQFMN